MDNKKRNKSNNLGLGSVFYNKQRDTWTCAYYVTDFKTGEKKRCKKRLKQKKKLNNFIKNKLCKKTQLCILNITEYFLES